jgi:hypothetical protein
LIELEIRQSQAALCIQLRNHFPDYSQDRLRVWSCSDELCVAIHESNGQPLNYVS